MASRASLIQSRSIYVGTLNSVAPSDGNLIVTGNVGIGTTAPSYKLSVDAGADGNVMQLKAAAGNTTDFGFDVLGGYIETNGASSGRRRLRIQTYNGTSAYTQLILDGENQRIYTSNNVNVGIGTRAPGGKLEVNHVSAQGSTSLILATYDNATANGTIRWQNNVSTNQAGISSNYTTSDAGALEFLNGDTCNLIIRSSGNVGIGTTSPNSKLEVFDGDISVTTGGSFSFLNLNRNFIPNSSGVLLGGMKYRGYSTGTTYQSGVHIYGYSTEAWTSTSSPGYLSIQTTPSGSTTPLDRMVVTSTGNVGIGTTSPVSKLNINNDDAWINVTDTLRGLQFGFAGPSHGSYRAAVMGGAEAYGGTDSGMLTFHTQNGYVVSATPPERMRITSAGNVGIGTNAPQLVGAAWTTLEVQGQSAGGGGVIYTANNGASVKSHFYSDGNGGYIGTQTNNYFAFTSNNIERMRITSAGNVGIGTTAPIGTLTVSGDGGQNLYAGTLRVVNTATTNAWGYIGLPDDATTQTSANNYYLIGRTANITNRVMSFHIPVASDYGGGAQPKFGYYSTGGDLLHSIEASTGTSYFKGNVGIGTTSPGGKLDVVPTSQNGINVARAGGYPSLYGSNELVFETDGIFYFGAYTPRLFSVNTSFYVTTSGNVGIGTTAPSSKFEVYDSANSNTFTITSDGANEQFRIRRYSNTNEQLIIGFHSSDYGYIQTVEQAVAYRPLSLNPNGGNVGIGTTSPANKLVVTSDASPTSENSYAIAAASASDPAYKTVIGYDFTNDIGLIAAVRTGIGWRNISMPQGSLGLGNIAPTEKLHITGNIRVTGAYYDSNNGAGTSGQVLSSTGTGTAWITASGTGTVTGTGSANRIPYWSSTSNLTFNSNLYWDNTNSRLGIGTTAPSAKVHLVEGNFVTRFLVGQSTFTGYNSGLTAGQKGNIIVGQANSTNNAYVINFIYQASSSTSNAIGLGFFNNDDIVVITAGKSVGIATTSPNTSYTTTIASVAGKTGVLLAQGNVKIDGGALGVGVNASGTAGRIDASNDIVPFSSSDLRLKENIKNIESPIEKVKKLNGIEFDWIKELEEHHGYSGHDTGVIAQEVQDVLPTAVRTNASGYLAVRYEKLIGLLIEAVKEQQAEIDYLKSKI